MNKTPVLMIVSSLAVMLAGCSSAKEQMGLGRSAPDEFMVVKRAPLSMPPDYTLAPPRPGAPRPQEQTPYIAAKEAVAAAPVGDVQGDNIILQQAGAEYANPDIRRVVDAETAKMVKDSKSVAKKLIGIGSDGMEESVLDPVEESKRLENINGTPADYAPEEEEKE